MNHAAVSATNETHRLLTKASECPTDSLNLMDMRQVKAAVNNLTALQQKLDTTWKLKMPHTKKDLGVKLVQACIAGENTMNRLCRALEQLRSSVEQEDLVDGWTTVSRKSKGPEHIRTAKLADEVIAKAAQQYHSSQEQHKVEFLHNLTNRSGAELRTIGMGVHNHSKNRGQRVGLQQQPKSVSGASTTTPNNMELHE